MSTRKKLSIIAVILLLTVSGAITIYKYIMPTELHAFYVSKQALYENDPISPSHFVVYTSSSLGKIQYIEDYELSSQFVDETGRVTVSAKVGKEVLSTETKLHPVKILTSEIQYDDVYYGDQHQAYDSNVSEVIYYADGSIRTNPDYELMVTQSVDRENGTVRLTAVGEHGIYEKSFPILEVTSITTKTKVSTKHKITADKLEFVLHYSDGSSAIAPKSSVTCKTIEHPKEGKNKLTCYYNGRKYKVKVKAYKPKEPKNSVTFENYGTYVLQYSKPYETGAFRLNSYDGITYFDNHRESYYSAKVLPGTALYIPGRHVAEDGTIRDQEGYIVAASDYSFRQKYTILLTSLGPAKIYDTGCPYGTIDIYVNW